MAQLKANTILETQQSTENLMLRESLFEARNELDTLSMRLEEKLANLDNMTDNRGWSDVREYGDDGPSLDQLKSVSTQIRNLVALNPHMKQGLNLRRNFIWSGGIHYANIPAGGRGRGVNVQALIDSPQNWAAFFGREARAMREAACFSDSRVWFLGDDATKMLRPVPLANITADYRNPDDSSEVWAYRHSWNHFQQGSMLPDMRHEWVFVNRFLDRRTKSIIFDGKPEPVNQSVRMFSKGVNGMFGWTYGVPDALPAVPWLKLYKDFLVEGVIMTKALAQYAYKLTAKSSTGANSASATIASNTGVGGTAAMTDGMDLTALTSAGRGYDFNSGRALIAAVSAALEVSVVAETASPENAGGSYAAASALDLPSRMAMQARRDWHVDFDREVLEWLGAPSAVVWFDALEDGAETYRKMQALVIKWGTGLYSADEMKVELESVSGRTPTSPPPDGVLLPNNEKSLKASVVPVSPQAVSPDQGQSNGSGGQNQNSGRTDTIN